MTRYEQIKEYLNERNIPIDSLEANSIIEGIEWADKHPKEGFISIDKAEKWLNENLYEYTYMGEFVGTLTRYVYKKGAINQFRKEMEEQL